MFTMERHVGRFCELRFGPMFQVSEMPRLRSVLAEIFGSQSGKFVFCTDLRAIDRFGPEEEKHLITLMQTDNPRVERSAMLVNANGRFGMQVLKMIQAADNRARRVFREALDLQTWLAPHLNSDEASRLRAFLLDV